VLEVNGIEVAGKTLDQVTDMMVANSANLIITVKPVNQRNNISPRRGGSGRSGGSEGGSAGAQSATGSTRSGAGSSGSRQPLAASIVGARESQKSIASHRSAQSGDSDEIRDHVADEIARGEEEEEGDEDEVEDHTVLEATQGGGDYEGGQESQGEGGVNNFAYDNARDSARSFGKKSVVTQ